MEGLPLVEEIAPFRGLGRLHQALDGVVEAERGRERFRLGRPDQADVHAGGVVGVRSEVQRGRSSQVPPVTPTELAEDPHRRVSVIV